MKLILIILLSVELNYARIPIVVNTWNFQHATLKAWEVLIDGSSGSDNALDALTFGCKVCQDEQCDNTVGYGGSPDENGETTLDALIFDGDTMDMGAIGGIRRIKDVMSVARHVLERSEHSLLVGSLAAQFAEMFEFPDESLQTNFSLSLWDDWKANNCQPNFWKNVVPDPKIQCGPYSNSDTISDNSIYAPSKYSSGNHDTIGMIVISATGHIVAGTSTNGAKFKIPGRVGDSPIPGAGAYADSEYGAAAATGDGDIMMRFLPSFLAVEQLRLSASPTDAAKVAISRIAKKYPSFFGGVVVVDKYGNVGAACNGMDSFPYTLASDEYPETVIRSVNCTNGGDNTLAKYFNSFLAVEQLRMGASPAKAAKIAISRITEKHPTFFGGIIVVDKKGNVGAACNGMDKFPYSLANKDYPNTVVKYVNCANKK